MKFKTTILILIVVASLPMLVSATAATDNSLLTTEAATALNEQDQAFLANAGLGTNSPTLVISMIIKIILSLLGVVFIVLIIYSGFRWLTSAGNEETITKAKKTLIAAIIGVAIVLSAYIITIFVIDKIIDATTEGPSRSIGSGGWTTTWGN